ncbi:magnesium/cobalt transporter CorA [Amycolatopsis sp. NPDC005232]|uniref:magnesium/cobalt transporter CorA n=1 Tax=unclassified Amycolatopsis TaxID=2618356 RepID=UPI001C6A060D|nr:magnesium/cobalt transporter CorA [Amycolatopsis sp. DSM 110486]QYN25223.1 magnesium/cobalt transporter CorA [Amycolatopsis sp. DSM 110486]
MPAIPSLGGLRGRGGSRTKPMLERPIPVPLSAYVVDCAVYVDGARLPGRWTHSDAIKEVRKRHAGFVWIGLHEPDGEQIQGIADTFGLHELAVEDALEAHQRPKLERYDDTLFLVLKTVRYVEHESPTTANEIVETGELMVFLGRDFVITVRHGNHSGLARLRRDMDDDQERLSLGPAAVVHAIADHVVDHYLEVSSRIESDIDEIEAQVFAPRSLVSAEQIYLMKREVLELRRAVLPLATPVSRLAEGYTRLVPDEVRSYFRDVADHLVTVSERVAAFDELLSTLVDATVAKISLQQNTDMRKITAWAAIITVPTMGAGIYGMNFDYMPELHWKFGYPIAVTVIFAICLLLYRIFRKNGWL